VAVIPGVKVRSAVERQRLIMRTVRSGEAVQVSDLARRLGVSQMSVRRDLAQLARAGHLTRVHGGAVLAEDEPPFGVIEVERAAAKDRIGHAAAALVQDEQTIMIDIGTTTLAFARHLHGRPLTVITSSLAIVQELLPDPEIELVVLGGIVRRNYRSMVGMLAEDALRQVNADIAFLGTSGIRRRDLAVMDTTMAETPIKRGMITAAQRTVLLADAAKFSMSGTVRVCDVNDLDAIVTDASEDEPAMAALTVEVVRA
jgi:DeoR/GlpR family transcriptional regulator of sugar metabolism